MADMIRRDDYASDDEFYAALHASNEKHRREERDKHFARTPEEITKARIGNISSLFDRWEDIMSNLSGMIQSEIENLDYDWKQKDESTRNQLFKQSLPILIETIRQVYDEMLYPYLTCFDNRKFITSLLEYGWKYINDMGIDD
jgi:hypothetical protein